MKKFKLHDSVIEPLVKRFPSVRWLKKGGCCGWAWWYTLSHPWVIPQQWWRDLKYAYQRATRGYDATATFDTCSHLSEYIPAILKELRNWGNSVPCFDKNCLPESHGLSGSDHDDSLIKWHAILDEIIAGFEAAHDLMDGMSPADNEFFDEWDRRYPGRDWDYWGPEHSLEDGETVVEWCTHDDYDALREELKVRERSEEWRKERMLIFHRGMFLFHSYFFDLWD